MRSRTGGMRGGMGHAPFSRGLGVRDWGLGVLPHPLGLPPLCREGEDGESGRADAQVCPYIVRRPDRADTSVRPYRADDGDSGEGAPRNTCVLLTG